VLIFVGDFGILATKIAGDFGILATKIAGDFGILATKIAGDLDFFVKILAYINYFNYLCGAKY